MSVITPEQINTLRDSARFQSVAKQFVKDRASYVGVQDGTDGNRAGLTEYNWARQRFIAKAIQLHPNSQDYAEWIEQFLMFLKGADVWNTDFDTTITGMIGSGKFEELATLTFALRAERIEF